MGTYSFDLLTEKRTFETARKCLTKWLEEAPEAYRQLFEKGEVRCSDFSTDSKALEEIGLVKTSGVTILAERCLYPFNGMFILCDRPKKKELDRVFPIFDDESVLLAKWINVSPNDLVLDLGTGSGIMALAAAQQGAKKVVATDINHNASKYLDLNISLNGFSDRIEYIHSDVFDQLDGEHWDLIASNPPFVPVPKNHKYFVHSDGGQFGTSIIERILESIECRLSSSGQLFLLALSLGGNMGWRVQSLLSKEIQLSKTKQRHLMEAVYKKHLTNLKRFTDHFSIASDHREWTEILRNNEYDRLGYFAIYIGPEKHIVKSRLERLRTKSTEYVLWPEYIGSMENRMNRYLA